MCDTEKQRNLHPGINENDTAFREGEQRKRLPKGRHQASPVGASGRRDVSRAITSTASAQIPFSRSIGRR
jgi:hypothetical protein